MSSEALSFVRLIYQCSLLSIHMRRFLDVISLKLPLILIQNDISHMHLGNMIETFFDLLTPNTK